jgi:hypothetical protein
LYFVVGVFAFFVRHHIEHLHIDILMHTDPLTTPTYEIIVASAGETFLTYVYVGHLLEVD